jgi:cell shape-determining protein MreC
VDVSESEESLETKFANLTEELNKARSEIEEFKTIKEAYEKQSNEYNQLKEDFIKMSKNFPVSSKIENKEEPKIKSYDELKNMDYKDAYDYLKNMVMSEINGNKDK